MLDKATVSKIANLARINVSKDETVRLANELTNIFDWIEKLNEVNTDSVTPMTSVVSMVMPSRADRVNDGNDADRNNWIVAGLLHDFDYERHPTKEEHPFIGVDYLRNNTDVGDEVIDAILGHATYSGVPRVSDMARTLFAVDELAGFIVACALVRPTGLEGMQAKSVKKKLKNKKFAAAVSREDIGVGIEELGVELSEHIDRCIDAIRTAGINIHT